MWYNLVRCSLTLIFLMSQFCVYPSEQSGTSGTFKPSFYSSGRDLSQGNLPASAVPKVLQGVSIQEQLGKAIDTNISFVDQNGKTKKLSEIINGQPIILSLNYYRCTTLCSLQLVNMANVLKLMKWPIGKQFRAVTISFDPTDTVASSLAAQKEYLNLADQPNGDWSFYTGSKDNIEKLTSALGYYFKYDPVSREYAHAAAIFFISPEGKISRYLYGITYSPSQVKFSLMDASRNKIGSHVDQVLLTCFHYNPTTGKYDWFAIGFLKIAASLTLVIFAILGFYFFRREKNRSSRAAAPLPGSKHP